jgi:hypothetical protein
MPAYDVTQVAAYQQNLQRAFLQSAMAQNMQIQQQLLAQNQALQQLLVQQATQPGKATTPVSLKICTIACVICSRIYLCVRRYRTCTQMAWDLLLHLLLLLLQTLTIRYLLISFILFFQ